MARSLFDDRVRPGLLLFVIVVATLFGGSAAPTLVLFVELAALPLLILVLAKPAPDGQLTRLAGLLCLAIVAVMVAQIIPLPDAWSRVLPGRESVTAIRDAAGLVGPFPLSLDPQATLASGLALIPGIAVLLGALRCRREELDRAVGLFVILATGSALLGVYQVATGGPYFFDYAHMGQSTGIFANRNHQGAFILAAMLLAVAPLHRWVNTALRGAIVATAIVMLGLCAVLTTSRATLLLLPIALGCALTLLLLRRRVAPMHVAVVLVAGAVLLAGATRLPVITPVIARLAGADHDGRFGFWDDTLVAIRDSWPVGTGFGTFPAVYATVENLDTVTRYRVNHAHNEIAEILLEGGVAGAALLLAWAGLVVAAAVLACRNGQSRDALAALGAIAMISLVSLTEFPLRNFAVAIGFALAHAILLRAGDGRR